jgi:hypothetical protein
MYGHVGDATDSLHTMYGDCQSLDKETEPEPYDIDSRCLLLRACTHKSAFCKRDLVNVRFAPKVTEVLRCRELTRSAITGREQIAAKRPVLDCLVGTREASSA